MSMSSMVGSQGEYNPGSLNPARVAGLKKLTRDIQSLSPTAIIELFQLDTTNYPGGSVVCLHAGTNELNSNIVWQGNTYYAFPIEVEGFEKNGQGSLPRPKIRVANITGLISALVHDFDDLMGCKITRKRTFAKYLDSENYPPGRNLLTFTQNYSSTSVNVISGLDISDNITLNPLLNGAVDASRLAEDSTISFHQVSKPVVLNNDTTYTYSVYCKKGSRRYVYLKVRNRENSEDSFATFDLQAGTCTLFNKCTPIIESTLNGYYRLGITFNSGIGDLGTQYVFTGINSTPNAPLAYLGAGSSANMYIWGSQLEVGNYWTEYQPVYGGSYIANPYADPNVHFPDEIWFIDRKSMENGIYIEFELATAFDVTGVMLPRRQCIQNTCPWIYRGEGCGYAGPPVADLYDRRVYTAEEDKCGKRILSCELRFGANPADGLPYGGFPGVGLVR